MAVRLKRYQTYLEHTMLHLQLCHTAMLLKNLIIKVAVGSVNVEDETLIIDFEKRAASCFSEQPSRIDAVVCGFVDILDE
jgi:hypothetical protein